MTPEELRNLATAAESHGHHIYTNPRDSNQWKDNKAWHEAASPSAVLGLLDCIAALEIDRDVCAVERDSANTRVQLLLRAKNLWMARAIASGFIVPVGLEAPAVEYRLLVAGIDTIEVNDEFLQDDAATWARDPNNIFVDMKYVAHALKPARRRISG